MLRQNLSKTSLYVLLLALNCLCLISACDDDGTQAASTAPSAPIPPTALQQSEVSAPTIKVTPSQNDAAIIAISSTNH